MQGLECVIWPGMSAPPATMARRRDWASVPSVSSWFVIPYRSRRTEQLEQQQQQATKTTTENTSLLFLVVGSCFLFISDSEEIATRRRCKRSKSSRKKKSSRKHRKRKSVSPLLTRTRQWWRWWHKCQRHFSALECKSISGLLSENSSWNGSSEQPSSLWLPVAQVAQVPGQWWASLSESVWMNLMLIQQLPSCCMLDTRRKSSCCVQNPRAWKRLAFRFQSLVSSLRIKKQHLSGSMVTPTHICHLPRSLPS